MARDGEKINAQAKKSAKYGTQESCAHVQTGGVESGERDRRRHCGERPKLSSTGLCVHDQFQSLFQSRSMVHRKRNCGSIVSSKCHPRAKDTAQDNNDRDYSHPMSLCTSGQRDVIGPTWATRFQVSMVHSA